MGRPRIYNLNESYFDAVDSNNKAYILGFIFADAHVTDKSLSIVISKDDVGILRSM